MNPSDKRGQVLKGQDLSERHK